MQALESTIVPGQSMKRASIASDSKGEASFS
jgi:hypothetical protein